MIGVANATCQNSGSVVATTNNSEFVYNTQDTIVHIHTLAGSYNYPLTPQSGTEELLERYGDACFIYPLLILNNVIIRDKEKLECFRGKFELNLIGRVRRVTKEKAEKLGIPDVPKDGVVFVATKKGVYIDLSCE